MQYLSHDSVCPYRCSNRTHPEHKFEGWTNLLCKCSFLELQVSFILKGIVWGLCRRVVWQKGLRMFRKDLLISIFEVEAYCSVLKMEVAGFSEMLVGLAVCMLHGVTVQSLYSHRHDNPVKYIHSVVRLVTPCFLVVLCLWCCVCNTVQQAPPTLTPANTRWVGTNVA